MGMVPSYEVSGICLWDVESPHFAFSAGGCFPQTSPCFLVLTDQFINGDRGKEWEGNKHFFECPCELYTMKHLPSQLPSEAKTLFPF